MNNCNHDFIKIRPEYRVLPNSKQYTAPESTANIEGAPSNAFFKEYLGQRVVCAYCGQVRIVSADGLVTIVRETGQIRKQNE